MRTLATKALKGALIVALASPALCADLVITQTKHTDASKSPGGRDQPAKDVTSTIWLGKDRMRIEDGEQTIIVRADQKKLYMLDAKAKTASVIDLPFDMKKYVPPEAAPMFESMMAGMKATLTPTTETKKIGEWNATKYTLTYTRPMGPAGDMSTTEEIWATKDVAVDRAAWNEMSSSMWSFVGGPAMAEEMKKIEGLPILVERTQTMMGSTTKSKDTVTSVASKDAPEGAYEVPKDFTQKPFNPMEDMKGGGMGGGRRAKPTGAGADKKDGERPPPPEPK
jgi:hypothetical protein